MYPSEESKRTGEDVVSAAHDEEYTERGSVVHKTTSSGLVLVPQPTNDPRDPLVCVGAPLDSVEAK